MSMLIAAGLLLFIEVIPIVLVFLIYLYLNR